MQKVLMSAQIRSYVQYLDAKVIDYLGRESTESFESFEDFDLMTFDWYDVNTGDIQVSQIIIYADREDLFFLCEDRRSYERCAALLSEGQSNERALYSFFVGLLKSDMARLDEFETVITGAEDAALAGSAQNYAETIREYRKELLRLKRYYEQLGIITDNLVANDNSLFTREGVRLFAIVRNRVDRFRLDVLNLRDYVTQMREAWQSQLDLEQNNLMRVFTVITAVFLPLTLIVGWYGMNFKYMPELAWRYGYIGVTVLSALVCVALLLWFRRRKWY